MNFDNLKEVLKIFKKSGLSYMEFEQDGMRVTFDNRTCVNNNVAPQVVEVSEKKDVVTNEASDDKFYVTSPLVGTFHQAQAEGVKPFVQVGQKVNKGDKLCIIEAMKVMNEITASKAGEIKEILVKEGQMVEFGQKLFEIGD